MKKKLSTITTTASTTDAPVIVHRDILLEDWAAMNGVKLRTAKDWAAKGKIKAKLKTTKITVTTVRDVKKYFIRSNAKKPKFVK